jgi:demethylmacrocin O-methyltransferase
LEIGIGGSEDLDAGGASLRTWRTFFPYSRIYGIDIHDKHLHDERRIKTFQGSQVDVVFLRKVVEEIGDIHIIIDDGSHRNEHVLRSFQFLFPKLHKNGIYVIEDTQTSYWPDQGGSSLDLGRPDTTMGFLKMLVDGLNYAEFDRPQYSPTFYDKYITAMHFYHNIVFIQKGLNNEGTYSISKGEWNKPW